MQTGGDAHDGGDAKRRRFEGDAPALHDSVTAGCAPDVPVEPVGTAVREWMDSIGLGKYADGLINDYNDLEDLQLNVDLGRLEKVCINMRGKVKMKMGDLDKFIRKLRECRDRFDKAGASIASHTPSTTPSSAPTIPVRTLEVLPKQPIFDPVDYRQPTPDLSQARR